MTAHPAQRPAPHQNKTAKRGSNGDCTHARKPRRCDCGRVFISLTLFGRSVIRIFSLHRRSQPPTAGGAQPIAQAGSDRAWLPLLVALTKSSQPANITLVSTGKKHQILCSRISTGWCDGNRIRADAGRRVSGEARHPGTNVLSWQWMEEKPENDAKNFAWRQVNAVPARELIHRASRSSREHRRWGKMPKATICGRRSDSTKKRAIRVQTVSAILVRTEGQDPVSARLGPRVRGVGVTPLVPSGGNLCYPILGILQLQCSECEHGDATTVSNASKQGACSRRGSAAVLDDRGREGRS